MKNNDLFRRLLYIAYKHNLSHIGSCLTALPIIDEIYEHKHEYEPFILSSGHAGLALYVVLEKYEDKNAEQLYLKHGVHPNRDIHNGLWCSTGSLGHGIGIAVGYALSHRPRKVHVLLSDGECAEGSVYEAFNVIREQRLSNIHIHINFNGWGAYRKITMKHLLPLTTIVDDICDVTVHKTTLPDTPFLSGLQAHYSVMTQDDYQFITNYYK